MSALQFLRIPTGLAVGEFDDLHLAVSWLAPDATRSNVVFVCLAGGGMTREFFDLPMVEGSNFSFVQALAQAGHGFLLVDHPGVGGSDQPEDGFVLTPQRVAEIHAAALQHARKLLPELADAQTIGVGHSMGAMITLIQQADHASHAGIILLGFGFDGLPQYLPPQARELLGDAEALNAAGPELARLMFRQPYPVIPQGGNGGLYAGSNAEPGATAAIKAVSTHLLAVPAFMSMYPHHWDDHASRINVPVLIALGDKDLVRPPDNVDQIFAASPAAEVMVLPQTGHSQFVFASRGALFARIGDWVDQYRQQGV